MSKEEIKKQILEEFKDINYAYNNASKYDTLKRLLDELTEEMKKRGDIMEDPVRSITMTNSAADTIEDALHVIINLFNAVPAEAEADLYLFSETITNLSIIKNHIEDEEGYEKIYKLRLYKKEREVK